MHQRTRNVMLVLILIVGAAYFSFKDLNVSIAKPNNTIISAGSDTGNIEVFFCPHQDCETEFIDFIHSSQISLHCALYEVDLESVKTSLLQKQQSGVEVLIVTDDDYLDQFNYSFVKADRSGLMHNKFCIVDKQKVSTGSMNPTNNDAHKNNNNLLFIKSEIIAQNYEDEFQELWNGTFKKGVKVKNPTINLNSTIIQTYFCPEDSCAEQAKRELKSARKSIHFMVFSFTHEEIGSILLLTSAENISIQRVLEVRQIDQDSQYQRLLDAGVTVLKDGNKYNLHHKVFIIDEETVITGSFNPTGGGNMRNDENLVIIRDKSIAKLFMQEFRQVWAEAGS